MELRCFCGVMSVRNTYVQAHLSILTHPTKHLNLEREKEKS